MTRLVPRIVAAALVVAATCVGVATPADASTCASASGVTVVVDFGALGSGLGTACDAGSGEPASTRFAQAGYPLTYVQRQPGFVCRVNGAPASDPCVSTPPADAYWGLFWSDGRSGTWTYASLGVTALDVPDGGSVALVWQQGTERRTPPVAAPVHQAPSATPSSSPSPTRSPTQTPTKAPGPSPTRTPSAAPSSPAASPTPSPSASGTASPSASPSRSGRPRRTPSPSPGGTADSGPSDALTPTDEAAATTTPTPVEPDAAPAADETRLPTWVTLAVLAVLVASIAISTAAARRRRRDGTGP